METPTGFTVDAGVAFIDPSLVPGLTDAVLLSSLEAAFAARRTADAAIACLAGEIAERSRPELGVDGLARRSGHANAAQLVMAMGRVGKWDADRFCKVGAATAARFSLAGERLPPQFETLAVGVNSGVVTVEAASHIITQLNAARSNADAEVMVAAESALVDFAGVGTADDVRRVAAQWRDHLDTDGIEPREEQLVAGRCLKRFWLSNGLKRYQLDADPERAAYLDAVLDAEIAAAFRATRRVRITGGDSDSTTSTASTDRTDAVARRDKLSDYAQTCFDDVATGHDSANASAAESGSVVEDTRTPAQIGADAFTDMARHVLSCENTTPTLATTTVVVRMTLDQLHIGHGAAQIGTDEHPISAGTARRLAADANIIPAVLGGKSEILDWGRARRLYSKAQKAAIIERDGGCICGCGNPGVYLEVHHIRWWNRDQGRTDLNQGVLTCTRAHTMIHTHGWDIRFIDNHPHLIPPTTIDPTQTPRRGARPPTPLRR